MKDEEIIDLENNNDDSTTVIDIIEDEAVNMNMDEEIKEEKEEKVENNDTLVIEETKKSKKIKLPAFNFKHITNIPKNIFIIAIIIFFVFGLLIGKMFFSKNYCSTGVKNTVVKSSLVSDGKNNVTEVNNFKYQIPSSYIYDKLDGYLLVYDKDANYKITIRSVKGSYDDLILSKVSIKESVKEQGLIVNDIKELVVSDNNHIVLDVTDNIQNHLLSFTSGPDGYVFYIDIVTNTNTIDNSILDIAEDIVRNATYVESVNKLESMRKVDIADISIKAAEEYKKATSKN